jgi:hypothetical protein
VIARPVSPREERSAKSQPMDRLSLRLRLAIALCRVIGHRWSTEFDNGRSIGRYCKRCSWTTLRGVAGGWSTEWRDLT